MESAQSSITVQKNGEHIGTITVSADASRSTIELAALKKANLSATQAKVTIVPGRIANVITQ